MAAGAKLTRFMSGIVRPATSAIDRLLPRERSGRRGERIAVSDTLSLLRLGLGTLEGVEPDESEIGKAFGGFELIREIGRGGMGVIYEARETATGRAVALKMIAPDAAATNVLRRRFEREIRAAAALDHPNIVPIYEVGTVNGTPYYSMKLAERGSVAAVAIGCERTPRGCALLVGKLADAIQHAHDRGVLHRDLKPANVLLDSTGEPMIADFGLAQLALDIATGDLTQTHIVLGTPGYIAPELASGKSSTSSDVYGLGAILYYLLSGRPPFEGDQPLAVLRQATAGPPASLRSHKRNVPRALDRICRTCLQPDPTRRYSSAAALADDLHRSVQGRRISRTARQCRRIPLPTLFASAVVAGLLVATLLLFLGQLSHPKATTGNERADYFLKRAREIHGHDQSESNLKAAEQMLRQAIALAPNAAILHAQLSRTLATYYWQVAAEAEVADEAKREANKALELAPDLGAAHLAHGEYLFRCLHDNVAALAEFRRSSELDPMNGTMPAYASLALKRLNRWEEALEEIRKAVRLAPNEIAFLHDLIVTLEAMRRYDEAVEAADRLIYLAPDDPTNRIYIAWLKFRRSGDGTELDRVVNMLSFEQEITRRYIETAFTWRLWSHQFDDALRIALALPDNFAIQRSDAAVLKPYLEGIARRALGQQAEAAVAFDRARAVFEQRLHETNGDALIRVQLAVTYAALGRGDEAVREGELAMHDLPMEREPISGSLVAEQLAIVYAQTGHPDEAIRLLQKLFAAPGFMTVYQLRLDPQFAPLRNDPRFVALIQGRR